MQEASFELVLSAVETLRDVTHVTPVSTSRDLDEISGARAFLKCENFQRAGAFKFRGAFYAVASHLAVSRSRVFATVSSGNHAQGLALACQLHGATAHVVMPKPFSSLKYQAVFAYGGEVHVEADRASAEKKLLELTENTRTTVVHAFNDPFVIAGQGTILVELLQQVDQLDAIVAPIGGGGLLSGLCLAASGLRPQLELFGCEPAGALDAVESVKQNRIVPMPNPHTMADGLRTSLGDRTLPILRQYVTGFFVVEESEIVRAMRFAFGRLKLVIEPSSAVALAPLLRREARLVGKRVGVVLTGGNVDLSAFWERLAADQRIDASEWLR